jgi:hypothetical protein
VNNRLVVGHDTTSRSGCTLPRGPLRITRGPSMIQARREAP